MTFVLGIYDLFAYAIPGFLYVSVLGFAADRAGWVAIDLKDLKDVPSLLIFVAVAIGAYLVGHVTWPLGRFVDRLSYRLRPWQDPKEIFLARDPDTEKTGYLHHSRFLLQARAELANREVASEISRMRAIGLMLRNCTIPLVAGATCAAAVAVSGEDRVFAASLSVLLLLAAVGAAVHSRTLGQWATLKTYEISYWQFEAGDSGEGRETPAGD
ncbi:hypothetical protein QLQ12_39155 [Actinoplanes sp. NEAU-A12]|uniref:Uncharacterized protein n=1 Tax=Actinoplanes sandaracinus TaxID=3045177 RepID=A0ABT6WXZ6_9ACTN|nr:hypothetical protein [Actinoplanes sandaracinus]MDI6104627.1 hypothetical protein [Actinoplanes sandaracinus]